VRYVVGPTKRLPSSFNPLNFSPVEIREMVEMGKEDAQNIVVQGLETHMYTFFM